MSISDWKFRRVLFRSLLHIALERHVGGDAGAAQIGEHALRTLGRRVAERDDHRVDRSRRRLVDQHRQPFDPGRPADAGCGGAAERSEEHTSELQSLMRISYAVFCLKKKTTNTEEHRDVSRTKDNSNINT